MKLSDLLKSVEENATDVADLVKVADIRRLEEGDDYRTVLIAELSGRYAVDAATAKRREGLDDEPPIII